MTQGQIAQYLGVSTPAVNKREKGSTFPDITLLPALARLLKIDLNTLMSFNEDLSDAEIERFVNGLNRIVQERGSRFKQQWTKSMNIQLAKRCCMLLFSIWKGYWHFIVCQTPNNIKRCMSHFISG